MLCWISGRIVGDSGIGKVRLTGNHHCERSIVETRHCELTLNCSPRENDVESSTWIFLKHYGA